MVSARTKTDQAIVIADVYRLALHKMAALQKQISGHNQNKPFPSGEAIHANQEVRERLILDNAFPNQSLTFEDSVGYAEGMREKAIAFANALDKEIGKELNLVTASPSLTANFEQSKESSRARKLFQKISSFSSKPPETNLVTLKSQQIEMAHVLRVLKAAQQGAAPDTKGYFIPVINGLYNDALPVTHADYMAVAQQTLKAMKPLSRDEIVIDVSRPGDSNINEYSKGIVLLEFGNNEYGFTTETLPCAIQIRSAYDRRIVNFESPADAIRTFRSLSASKTLADVNEILGLEENDVWDKAKVTVRHTRAGNFIDGSFSDDKYHPNPAVSGPAALEVKGLG